MGWVVDLSPEHVKALCRIEAKRRWRDFCYFHRSLKRLSLCFTHPNHLFSNYFTKQRDHVMVIFRILGYSACIERFPGLRYPHPKMLSPRHLSPNFNPHHPHENVLLRLYNFFSAYPWPCIGSGQLPYEPWRRQRRRNNQQLLRFFRKRSERDCEILEHQQNG